MKGRISLSLCYGTVTYTCISTQHYTSRRLSVAQPKHMMKPTQGQVALGVTAVVGVTAVGVAWFMSTRRKCSAVKVADLVNIFWTKN